jgi:B12-binding domain/radical SAM domain protein
VSDLVLLHPPSIFDFRERKIRFGPLSDVIPSSPIFEMYPIGFLTLAAHLRKHGYRTRIINLALLMMRSRRFEPAKLLARLHPKLFGIDLHWLPHAHGAIELARLLKRLHPDLPIVFGGISATYYGDELLREPAVDYVISGSVAEPALLALMRAIDAGSPPKRGAIPSCPPPSLDPYDIDLGMMIRDVVTRLDFWSSVPFHSWWRHPITAVFTVRGCRRGCVTCGAPRQVIFRSPEAIAAQVRALAEITRVPIFLVGDLCDGGDAYAHAVVDALGRTAVRNRVIFEFFDAPDDDLIARIDRSVAHWGAEFSPESHDEGVRALLGKATFTNARMESAIDSILRRRCEQLDLFYMTGLPGQTYDNAMETVDSIESLFQRFDRRLSAFITPMGPFLDPGSDGFEDAEARGYILHARTLAEHRALLEQNDWESMLNYETRWMTRREIVKASYDARARLDGLKRKYGRTPGKAALFPPAAVLRNFRIGGIARVLLRDILRRDKRHPPECRESSPAVPATPNLLS